jgi:hypothetical protein
MEDEEVRRVLAVDFMKELIRIHSWRQQLRTAEGRKTVVNESFKMADEFIDALRENGFSQEDVARHVSTL